MNIPTKLLEAYYSSLRAYHAQGVTHELGLRAAFANLLESASKPIGWTLVQEQALANRARPDGTMYDSFKIPRGYWEAKDSADDLDAEIRKKINRGYPLTNTIFEDTQRGVLYQNGRVVYDADLTKRTELAELMSRFFDYSATQIEEFHTAVRQFQDQIPELARGLEQLIEQERGKNQRFVSAFSTFEQVCRTAINPNISMQAIEEMLVQHLLTERLFRTVFGNENFTRRNVIAQEIEKVIDALTSRAFSRREYLRQLDHFYQAIEDAARTIDDWSEKQGFLNTIYERFFQGFSKKQADTHGVVYTPQPIVDFMVNSVEEILNRSFGTSLSTPGVKILDPATGTGNFIVNILRRINRRDLRRKYSEDLFANEVMLLPYYVASLNIEHAYYELTSEYSPFEGIVFADTLDLAEDRQMSMFSEENTERVNREREAEITVIIGNPPYNVGQLNENDNNKNRRYDVVDRRVRETYAKDSRATNKNALGDVYVKFFRWASDRLRGRDGVICYVTNNSFVDQIAFDGMRKHLDRDFDQIYHIDLHGNVRQNPKLSGTTHNVFGIQVGVGITIAVRSTQIRVRRGYSLSQDGPAELFYHRVPEFWRKIEKLSHLSQAQTVAGIAWQQLAPDAKHTWVTEGMQADFAGFLPLGSKEAKSGATHPSPLSNPHPSPLPLGEGTGSPLPEGEGRGVRAPAALHAPPATALLHPHPSPLPEGEGTGSPLPVGEGLGVRESPPAQRAADTNTIFHTYGGGIKANRDIWVYDFSRDALAEKTQRFIETYNNQLDRWQRRGDRAAKVDDFVTYDDRLIKWSESLKMNLARGSHATFSPQKIRTSLYRPFSKQYLFFDRLLTERVYQMPSFFPTEESERENSAICITDAGSEKPFLVMITNTLADLHLVGAGASCQCFPFYTYSEDGSQRRENITDWALATFQAAYGAGVTKRDIFHYIYAILHHPQYRETYRENLRRELPRIPMVGAAANPPPSPLPLGEGTTGSPLPLGEGLGVREQRRSSLPAELLHRIREMRRNATEAEALLWGLLRNRQLAGAKFRRQHPHGTYILDFFCNEAKLAIEVDGSGHQEENQRAYDAKRTKDLAADGIYVLRFWNSDVLNQTDAVLETIWQTLQGQLSMTSAPPDAPDASEEMDIPRASATEQFRRFADIGEQLTQLHLNYEAVEEYPLTWMENRDVPFSWNVEKMRLNKGKDAIIVNRSLTLGGVPEQAFAYKLGNRSALEWIIDQYQITTDSRSGITTDPNRLDDEEYIVRLLGRIITVSLQTIALIESLPPLDITNR